MITMMVQFGETVRCALSCLGRLILIANMNTSLERFRVREHGGWRADTYSWSGPVEIRIQKVMHSSVIMMVLGCLILEEHQVGYRLIR